MIRRIVLAIILMACSTSVYALGKLQGYVEQGGQAVTTGLSVSTTKVQKSYTSSTVTAYLAGTTTLATIYSDASSTVKANPFTADTVGFWFFFANEGCYDVKFSPAGVTPWTQLVCTGTGLPLNLLIPPSTITGGTVEGLRDSILHLYSTDLSSYNDCALDVNVLSRYLPVASVTITNGGAGYTSGALVSFSASPIGNTATGTVTVIANVVSSITITNGGSYPSNVVPTATITPVGAGAGALGTSVLRSFIRTGIHSKIFTNPDNGESSGMLIVQTGGGSGLTAYKFTELRPTGYEDYSDSPQGAAEIMTSGSSFAGYFVAGANVSGYSLTAKKSTAVLAAVNNAGSRGFVCSMSDLVWDTRDCFVVGSHQSDAAPVNVHWRVQANGNMSSSGTIKERDRTTAVGEWTTPTFDATNFDGNGTQTFTLAAGDVTTFEYTLIGKTMIVSFVLLTTSVGGAPDTDLRILIPGGFTAAKTVINSIAYSDNGAAEAIGTVRSVTGTARLVLRRINNANWSAAANTTNVSGQLTFEIN